MSRHALLVTGSMHPATLHSALYGDWRIDTCLTTRDGAIVATVSAPDDVPYGFGPGPQAAHLRSFGTVGVLEVWEEADVLASVLRAIPRDTLAASRLT